ncbi:MAG TPA: SusC/RagA family TonB-linked outer membrane protein, partial [Saprospiraceae bacterium]|nr:SusC/RagA family TonB-linked outer membrane protein [Saprospiraceae bacterium]
LYNMNLVGKYDILPNLSYKINALFSKRFRDEGSYRTRLHSEAIASNGSASLNNSEWGEYLVENILNYNKDFNKDNRLDLTFVHSVNQRDFSRTTSNGTNFSNDLLGFNGISNALNYQTSRDQNRRRLLGYLGRVRYNLMDKYLVTFTARQDGSSVFAENQKWGFFPAAAFAWKAQNESFLQNVKAINELKVRMSYGSVGNEAISPFQTLGLVTNYPYIFGNNLVGGNLPGNVLPNPNLSWETSTTFNTGIDFGLFKNFFTGSIDYYKTRTTDLLTNVPLGGTSGFTSTITNGGETENSGIEVLLTTNLIKSKDFNWSITTAFTKNNNKLIKSGLVDANGNPVDDISRNRFIGQSLNPIFTHVFDGIFQSDQEALNSPQGTLGGTVNPFQPITTLHAGSIRIKDVNSDGVINELDRVIINTVPKWFGSLATNLSFKGFELMADIYSVQGVTRNNPYLALFNEGGYNTSVRNGIIRDYWTPENPSNTYPRPNFNVKAQNIEILQVADASYIRLRTLSLAYNLKGRSLEKIKLNNMRIYAIANNLLTITDYKSYSPENNPNQFPDAKGFTFGINLGF